MPTSCTSLCLSAEDEAFQTELALLGPYDDQNHGIFDYDMIYRHGSLINSDDSTRLAAYDTSNIRLLLGIGPGPHHDLGDAEGPTGKHYTIAGSLYQLGHALCFRLVEMFAPRLMHPPGNFWATMRAANGIAYENTIKGVDYFEIMGSMEQFVNPWHRYYEHGEAGDMWPYDLLNIILKREVGPDDLDGDYPEELDKALKNLDPAFVRDYWLGFGAMFVFVRPDRFPIAEAYESTYELCRTTPAPAEDSAGLASLPLDVFLSLAQYLPLTSTLALLALSRTLRSKLLPAVDTLVHESIPVWALPGPQERAEWDAQIQGFDRPMPWLAYARECIANSASMRNRERIWKIVQQIEALAIREGIVQRQIG